MAIEKSQAALQGEFAKVLASTTTTSNAVEELKCMFSSFMGKLKGTDPSSPSVCQSAGEKIGVICIPSSDVLPMQSEVTHEGTELVPKGAHSADDEEKETGLESMQLDSTAAVVGEEVSSTLKPKTTSTVNPVMHPAVLDCLPKGPSRAPKRIPVGPADIQNLSEDTMPADVGGPSAEDVENKVETEQQKGDPKIVGGDVENPYVLPGEAANVNPEESGKTSGAAAVKGNPVPNTQARHLRAIADPKLMLYQHFHCLHCGNKREVEIAHVTVWEGEGEIGNFQRAWDIA